MTTVYTIRDNLKNTIRVKEDLLQEYREESRDFSNSSGALLAIGAAINFLEVNIAELKTILADVEIACNNETDRSWANDDRQMGV